MKLSEGLSETEKVKLAYWTAYRDVAGGHPEFLKEFSPQKPSKDHWSMLRLGVSAYHLALLIDTHKGRTGIELYVDDDKEIGHRAIANSGIFEEHLGLTAAPFDAKRPRDCASTRRATPSRATRTHGRGTSRNSSDGPSR